MEEQFVPYELALKLKELGFKEDCFRYYNVHGELGNSFNLSTTVAPLWQQAFDWFREKHNIYFTVDYGIDFIDNSKYWVFDKGYPNNTKYKTYEEARLECLKELIKRIEL